MEILASCSRISTFGIRLPQSLSEFSPRRLTVYCRCFTFFYFMLLQSWGTPCITNIQTISRTCNNLCQYLTFLTKYTLVSQQRRELNMNNANYEIKKLLPLSENSNYIYHLKKKTYFHKPVFIPNNNN